MIDLDKLKTLISDGLRLDHYLVLHAKAHKTQHLKYYKIDAEVYDKLIEMELLTKTRTIRKKGLSYIGAIPEDNSEAIEAFSKFWSTYPSDDGFDHYPATRAIRGNMQSALTLWAGIALLHSPQALQNAVEAFVEAKTQSSRLTGKNEFTFIPSVLKWLRDEHYLVYMNRKTKKNNLDEIDLTPKIT